MQLTRLQQIRRTRPIALRHSAAGREILTHSRSRCCRRRIRALAAERLFFVDYFRLLFAILIPCSTCHHHASAISPFAARDVFRMFPLLSEPCPIAGSLRNVRCAVKSGVTCHLKSSADGSRRCSVPNRYNPCADPKKIRLRLRGINLQKRIIKTLVEKRQESEKIADFRQSPHTRKAQTLC